MILVAVSGCCPNEDTWRESPGPAGADEALAYTLARYDTAFGHSPDDIRIRWTREQMYDNAGEPIYGKMYGCNNIWIMQLPGRAPSGSSLTHELAHCYADDYGLCGLHADNDHGETWIWDKSTGLVETTNAELAARGL